MLIRSFYYKKHLTTYHVESQQFTLIYLFMICIFLLNLKDPAIAAFFQMARQRSSLIRARLKRGSSLTLSQLSLR